MTRIIECGAGLDVHQATVVATIRRPDGAGARTVETRTFSTHTRELLALRDWLAGAGVTDVAVESTGVYWRPVYYVLEDQFRLVLVNMRHLKLVPGRKTDVQDSAWLAQCLEWGLLRSSFVPPPVIRDLRELTRYRQKQLEDRAREVNRVHKVLEDAGLKLSTVMSDVLGVSGRAMLTALLSGTTDPAVVAELARGRLRTKRAALRDALQGQVRAPHAFLLSQILSKIDFLDETLAQLTTEIDRQVRPFEPVIARLITIPGIARRTATIVLAETGGDMTQFPTAGHLCSWAGMCPGHDESAGKRRSGKTRKANRYLRGALIEAAWATTRATSTALHARYRRLKRRRGHKRAAVAVGHQILTIAYYVMGHNVTYHELGADYFDRRDRAHMQRYHVRHLEQLGYRVTIEPAA